VLRFDAIYSGKMMLHIRKMISALFVGILLSGCGGGGSSSTTLTSFPIQAPMQAFYTAGFTSPTLHASGTAAGSVITAGTGTEVVTINASTANSTFPNTMLQSTYSVSPSATVTTTSGSIPLGPPVQVTSGTYYFNSTYSPTGYIDSNGNNCEATAIYGFPTTLTAEQSNTIATYNCYTSSPGVFSGAYVTQQLTYATYAGSSTATPPTNLNFVLTNTTYSGGIISPGQIVSTVAQTFQITSTGTNTATASLIKIESQFTSGGSWDITFQ
jgi:hypothetical protein